MYDICIVGAGPAGATLARLIPPRYRVLLVDSRTFDVPDGPPDTTEAAVRDGKPCGGLLAPKAQRELVRQGLGLPGAVVVGPQLFGVRALDVASGLERTYQRFYVNVDRELFDRWLVSLLPRHVETAFGYRVSGLELGHEDPLVRLTTSGGGEASIVARLVVGADGALSNVRRLACRGVAQPTRYAAVQAAFAGVRSTPYYGAIFDPALTDFYGWTIPKGDVTLAGIAAPTGRGAREAFEAFVTTARAAGFVSGDELGRSSAVVVRPRSVAAVHTGTRGVALVGEAAGFVSPSSAEGISYALRSARLLANAVEPGLSGAIQRYDAAAMGLKADIALRIAKSSAIYSPGTRRLLMRSGLGAVQVAGNATPQPNWADTLGF